MIDHITHVLKISLPLMTESSLESVDSTLKLLLSFLQNNKASLFITDTINQLFEQIASFSADSLKSLKYLEKIITDINQKINESEDGEMRPAFVGLGMSLRVWGCSQLCEQRLRQGAPPPLARWGVLLTTEKGLA